MRETTIEIPGLSLAAKWWGPRPVEAGTTPVLGLHGWLDNAASFDRLVAQLGRRTFVALDFPGHGRSDHFGAFTSYLFVEYVAAVWGVLDALAFDRVDLVGHSLGGGVAALLAGTAPERVRRLVMIEGLGPLAEPAQGAPARLARSLSAHARHHARQQEAPVYPDVESVVHRLRAVQSSMSIESARILLQRGLADVPGGVTWRSDRRLRHPSRLRLTEPQVLAFLEAIAAPVLLIRARDGLAMASELSQRRMEAIEDLSVVEVEGGHHVHLDAAERVAPHVESFIDPEGSR